MQPTQETIQAEIRTLSLLQPTIRATSAFGDDNRAAVDAQVTVLNENMSRDDIYARFGDTGYITDSALDARDWLDGESDSELLSENWAGLVQPPL